MPSLFTSLTNLLSSLLTSILALIQTTLSTILSITTSIATTFYDLFATIIATFGRFLGGIVHAFEGVGKFLIGNIVVLAGLAVAVGGYVVYQNRRGGAVAVPGTGKKVN